MKISVDEFLCDGHAVCVDACPEVFALDDDDETVRILDAEPGESFRGAVEQAASTCPKTAITVEG